MLLAFKKKKKKNLNLLNSARRMNFKNRLGQKFCIHLKFIVSKFEENRTKFVETRTKKPNSRSKFDIYILNLWALQAPGSALGGLRKTVALTTFATRLARLDLTARQPQGVSSQVFGA